MELEERLRKAYRQNNDVAFDDAIMQLKHMQEVLESHRRFHGKAGCPGRPECYVCAEEEWAENHKGD